MQAHTRSSPSSSDRVVIPWSTHGITSAIMTPNGLGAGGGSAKQQETSSSIPVTKNKDEEDDEEDDDLKEFLVEVRLVASHVTEVACSKTFDSGKIFSRGMDDDGRGMWVATLCRLHVLWRRVWCLIRSIQR